MTIEEGKTYHVLLNGHLNPVKIHVNMVVASFTYVDVNLVIFKYWTRRGWWIEEMLTESKLISRIDTTRL